MLGELIAGSPGEMKYSERFLIVHICAVGRFLVINFALIA